MGWTDGVRRLTLTAFNAVLLGATHDKTVIQ